MGSGAAGTPGVLVLGGAAVGLGQAATDVMYLTGLAMLGAVDPRPLLWPLIVVAYCAIMVAPPLLVVFLAARRTVGAQLTQRRRFVTDYGPAAVRVLALAAASALTLDAGMYLSGFGFLV